MSLKIVEHGFEQGCETGSEMSQMECSDELRFLILFAFGY